MPYTHQGKITMLNAIRGTAPGLGWARFASLHTAVPGEFGASEVSGGAPAYARLAITWDAPAEGSPDGDVEMALAAQVVFDVPSGTTVTHVGFWSDLGDGSPQGLIQAWSDVTDEVFGAQGTYTLQVGTTFDLNLE